MNERIIEIKADSIEEAEKRLQIEEIIVLEETILCREKVETIEAVADTVEEAFIKARSKVPTGAKAETQKIKAAPKQITLQVQADNEEGAGKGKTEVIASVTLIKKGKKGFWGFGKTPNVYEVVISQQALVELTYRVQAELRAKVRGYLAEDLLQSIREVRRRNSEWTEIFQLLNPKNESEIQASLMSLRELNPLSALETIEEVCLKNEKVNWQSVIKKVHTQALDARRRELEKQKIRMRRLDVEIAETFMFYTSIDWSEKDYAKKRKEPTGLPRIGYGKDNVISPSLRRTIPHFSSQTSAFSELEERIKGFNLYELYLQLLCEEGQDEMTAELELKCVTALKTHKLQNKRQ